MCGHFGVKMELQGSRPEWTSAHAEVITKPQHKATLLAVPEVIMRLQNPASPVSVRLFPNSRRVDPLCACSNVQPRSVGDMTSMSVTNQLNSFSRSGRRRKVERKSWHGDVLSTAYARSS